MKNKKVHICIYDPYLATKGGGEKCAIATAEALARLKNARVTILINDDPKNINKKELESYFKADLSRVDIAQVKEDPRLLERLNKYHKHMPRMIGDFYKAYVENQSVKEHNIDIFINNFYKSNIFNPAPVGIYFCMFPQALAPPTPIPKGLIQRGYRKAINIQKKRLQMESEPARMLSTYQSIISISEFTHKWVKELWNRESDIVYPICEDMYKKGIDKKKIILNVGRFFAQSEDNHHKKQEVLLDTFLQMEDLQKQGWELHFAGGIARDTEAMEFALELVMKARDYPVFFHFGAPFDELQALYNEATIYWHATGYGVDEDKFPDRQEHFGITTVEAMSAGAIPVVLNAAGQKDTVINNKTGYLWNTLDELKSITREVVDMTPGSLSKLRDSVVAQSNNFDKRTYQKKIVDIVSNEAAKKGIDLV